MDSGGDRLIEPTTLRPSNIAVVREVYDSEFAHEAFAIELERALEAKCTAIVIEPALLADETARWISIGNSIHRTAVLSGIGAIVTGLVWADRPVICTPLSSLSLLCSGLYTIAWQFDPCVKYQVENDTRRLARLPVVPAMASGSPVVLVRKDDTKRKLLHCTVSLLSAALCAYRIYNSVK